VFRTLRPRVRAPPGMRRPLAPGSTTDHRNRTVYNHGYTPDRKSNNDHTPATTEQPALRHNERMPDRRPRPQLKLIAPAAASAEEAAAIVAALERFMRATAPAPAAADDELDPWRRAALLEGVSRAESWADVPDPWINT
jgi:hypothetical protein